MYIDVFYANEPDPETYNQYIEGKVRVMVGAADFWHLRIKESNLENLPAGAIEWDKIPPPWAGPERAPFHTFGPTIYEREIL